MCEKIILVKVSDVEAEKLEGFPGVLNKNLIDEKSIKVMWNRIEPGSQENFHKHDHAQFVHITRGRLTWKWKEEGQEKNQTVDSEHVLFIPPKIDHCLDTWQEDVDGVVIWIYPKK